MELVREHAPDGTRPADNALVRDAVAREWVELQALRFTNYRSLTALVQRGVPGPEGSVAKLVWSEAAQRIGKLARQFRNSSQLSGRSVWNGFWQTSRRSRGTHRSRSRTTEQHTPSASSAFLEAAEEQLGRRFPETGTGAACARGS